MFRSPKAECDATIAKLAIEASDKIDEIEEEKNQPKPRSIIILTKELSAIYQAMAEAFSGYANCLEQREKVLQLRNVKDHYQLAINELNKFAFTKPLLLLYLDQLYILDQLLKLDNLFADIYAKQMLAIITAIGERGLLLLPDLHQVFLSKQNETLYDFAHYWVPVYLEHAQEENLSIPIPLADDIDHDNEQTFKQARKDLTDSMTIASFMPEETAVDEMIIEPTAPSNVSYFNFFAAAPRLRDLNIPMPSPTVTKRFNSSYKD